MLTLSFASTLASFASSAPTTSKSPFSEAMWSGVRPSCGAGQHCGQRLPPLSSRGPPACPHLHTPSVALKPGPCLPPFTRPRKPPAARVHRRRRAHPPPPPPPTHPRPHARETQHARERRLATACCATLSRWPAAQHAPAYDAANPARVTTRIQPPASRLTPSPPASTPSTTHSLRPVPSQPAPSFARAPPAPPLPAPSFSLLVLPDASAISTHALCSMPSAYARRVATRKGIREYACVHMHACAGIKVHAYMFIHICVCVCVCVCVSECMCVCVCVYAYHDIRYIATHRWLFSTGSGGPLIRCHTHIHTLFDTHRHIK
jgi:hypothetical protein